MNCNFENIIEQIGEPIYRGERFAIFNDDSLQLLLKVPEKSINLIFTSPPYNIGKSYEKIMPISDYIAWTEKWISLTHNIVVENGAFLLNVGYVSIEDVAHAIPIPYLIWDKIPYYLQQEIIWNYGAGVACKKYLSPRNEKLLWYVKNKDNYTFNLDDIRDPNVLYPNQKKHGRLRNNSIGKNPSDVWQIAKVTSGANRSSKERCNHPAQFPLDLCERVIKGFSNQGEIVLDPFLGSGSSMECALKNQRFCIGFELKKEYCDIAFERVKDLIECDK